MTQSDRDLIERFKGLLANATPGPWYTLDAPWLPSGSETSILAESPDPHVARFICDFDIWELDDDEDRKSENPDADAALVVAAVNELPGLLYRLQALSAEVERLRLDLEAAECLQVSQYRSGMKLGWNLCVNDDEEGFAKAMGSTEYIAELRRINDARQALKGANNG